MARTRTVALRSKPIVYFCTGSDCRKRKSGQVLRESLSGKAEVCEVRCQKVCKGPVVGLELDGRVEWFSKMKSKSMRKRLVALVTAGELPANLAVRRVRKRSGHFRSDVALVAK